MKSDSSIGRLEPLVGEWEVEGFIHQKPAGRWESSEEGKKWNYDFDLIYSRGKP